MGGSCGISLCFLLLPGQEPSQAKFLGEPCQVLGAAGKSLRKLGQVPMRAVSLGTLVGIR